MQRWTLTLLSSLAALPLSVYVAIDQAPVPGDVAGIRAVQSVEGLGLLAEAVNWAGDLRWIPAAAFLAVWLMRCERQDRRAVLLTGFVLLVLQGGSQVLKLLVDSPRPSPAYGVAIDRVRESGGFPSGHVYGDVLTYGTIAVLAPVALGTWSAAVRVPAVTIVALAGWARVYVGAHWPSDVVGGYLWGAAALGVVLAIASRSLVPSAGASMAAELPNRHSGRPQAGEPRSRERQESDSR